MVLSIVVLSISTIFVACKKSATSVKEPEQTSLVFKSDAERDKNSVVLSKMISQDMDWKELVKLNYEFLDIVVKSDAPIENFESFITNKGFEKFNTGEYLTKLKKAKELAANLKRKYFSNSAQCLTCEEFTNTKLQKFRNRINEFRSNRQSYYEFLAKIGIHRNVSFTALRNGNIDTANAAQFAAEAVELPDCNNWRFTLCAGACVVTAPTGILFAACMAMCIAEFC